jgi:hypothetical protein
VGDYLLLMRKRVAYEIIVSDLEEGLVMISAATLIYSLAALPQDSAPMVAHERALGTAATEAAAGSALRLLRRLSPVSSIRWALWTRRSRMASA